MYSNIRGVQILISFLKEYGIHDVVIAPGGSNIPIIHSIENDSYFNCYSVIDERSMVYFALGISQEKNIPVACICTSGTAVSNFLPGITEAFYQNVPIVAITADKNPYFLEQLETQKIRQNNLFNNVCKKCVDLPLIENKDDEWLFGRLINEALLSLSHNGYGPVQINIPIVGNVTNFTEKNLPKVKKIDIVNKLSNSIEWGKYSEKLYKASKILCIIGQNICFSERINNKMEEFFKHFNLVYAVEHMSNYSGIGAVYSYPLTETSRDHMNKILLPEIVISFGNNISSYEMKSFLRNNSSSIEHWVIDESGRIRDTYQSLTALFECTIDDFIENIINHNANTRNLKIHSYYDLWRKAIKSVVFPVFEYSSIYIDQLLASVIPENSVLHLAILSSTRVMQFFPLKTGVKTYSNIGALGIDGCLSSFIGQACSSSNLAFCLIGDLSFFYDMNAVSIKHLKKNARIILLNNGGATEFHLMMGRDKIPSINKYIAVDNKRIAKGWIESLGLTYYSVQNAEDAEKIIPMLAQQSDRPVFVEVFTDKEKDAQIIKEFYNENYPITLKSTVKTVAEKVLPDKQYDQLIGIYKKIINDK